MSKTTDGCSRIRSSVDKVARKQPPPRQLLRTGEACAELGISKRSLNRWVAAGLLESGRHFVHGLTPRSPRRWDVAVVERRIPEYRNLPVRPCPDVDGEQAAADN